MDNDDYETMSEDYTINSSDNNRSNFFYNYSEMQSNMAIRKEELDRNDMSGDPKDMKQIRRTTSVNTDAIGNNRYRNPQQNQQCSSSVCGTPTLPAPTFNYRICPICSGGAVMTCNCTKHDSACAKGHTWHVKNGKIKLGHSH